VVKRDDNVVSGRQPGVSSLWNDGSGEVDPGKHSPVPGHRARKEQVRKEDIAGCALFLGSRLSAKITGQVIHVDAGLSSSLII